MDAPRHLRVVVAEDSYLIREGLRLLVGAIPEVDVVAVAGSVDEATAAIADHDPDVVVTDIRMPPLHLDEGIALAETLAQERPRVGVVVLSGFVEPEWALRLFEPTAARRAYLLKERVGDLSQIQSAIFTVADGGTVLDPSVVDALVSARERRASSPLAGLTERELEILSQVAMGHSNAQIALNLFLTERTVEKHISSVLAKLDLDSSDASSHRRVRAVLLYLSAVS